MSETAKKLFEGLANGVKALSADIVRDVGAESKRMTIQGASELAAALFSQSAFLPYGPGQSSTSKQATPSKDAPPISMEQARESPSLER